MSYGKTFLALFLLLVAGFAYFLIRSNDAEKPSKKPRKTTISAKKEPADERPGIVVEARPETVARPKPTRAETLPTASSPEGQAANLQKGFGEIERREISEAERTFLEHVELYPLDPQGHFGLGVVYRLEEYFDQSRDSFNRTLQLNPEHVQAKMQMAEMLTFQMKDDYETAEKLYREILTQYPAEKSAANGLATVYLSTGRADDAIQIWEGLREEMPDQEVIAKNLGNAYFLKGTEEERAGNTDAAAEWLSRARELNPEAGPVD